MLNFWLLPITAKYVKVSSYMAHQSKFDLDTCGKTGSQYSITYEFTDEKHSGFFCSNFSMILLKILEQTTLALDICWIRLTCAQWFKSPTHFIVLLTLPIHLRTVSFQCQLPVWAGQRTLRPAWKESNVPKPSLIYILFTVV